MLSRAESEYLKPQYPMRFATASRNAAPNVVTMGFEFDRKYFYTGRAKREMLRASLKYINIRGGNKRMALAIDDLVSVDLWKPKGKRVDGTAEIVERGCSRANISESNLGSHGA